MELIAYVAGLTARTIMDMPPVILFLLVLFLAAILVQSAIRVGYNRAVQDDFFADIQKAVKRRDERWRGYW